MPITVRHTPVGVLGRLAVSAGQARGRQLQMGRDIQLSQIAMAAQSRAWAIDAAARNRAFALQRAGATQIARQRPAEPDTLAQRQKLRQFVAEAKAADIYDPTQIKQAQIFADLGDEQTVRSILGRLPQPTVRRRELQQQLEAFEEIQKGSISQLQQQLNEVSTRLGKRFTPGTQQLLRERPEYMATVSPDIRELLAQQQQLEEQIADTTQRTERTRRMLQLGIAIPEQLALESRQEVQLRRQETAEQRALIERVKEAGRLTEREELAIDVMRDRERDKRTVIDREISRLSKDLAPFQDEDEDEHAERINPIQSQIRQLELNRIGSFAGEKSQIEEFLRRDKKEGTPIVTDATGQRWRFTGRYRNGKPIYEAIE